MSKWKYIHTREISFYGNYIAAYNYSKSLSEELGFSLDEYVFCSRGEKTAETFVDKKTVKNVERMAIQDEEFVKNLITLFEKNIKDLDRLYDMLVSYKDIKEEGFASFFREAQDIFMQGFSALRLPLIIEGLLDKDEKMREQIMRSAKLKDKLGEGIYRCMRLIEGKIFDKIGAITRTYPKLLVYATPIEINSAIEKKKMLDIKELQRRKDYVIMIRKGEINILSGEKAIYFINSIEKESSKKLEGKCGSPGKATGKVKIALHASDLDDIKEPVIMVCRYSSEEFTKHFHKFSAIVTGDSGILNHAATVAREHKIPCIVGIKDVEKMLKDGDLVEVDADIGIVRKIK